MKSPRTDIATAAALFLAAALLVWFQSGALDRRFTTNEAVDTWFDADSGRVVANLTDRHSNYDHAKIHPIMSLLLAPPTMLARRVFQLEPLEAVRLTMAAIAGLWMASFFGLCRLLQLRRLDAVVATALAGSTTVGVFWFGIPESHPFGSISIIAALALVAASGRHPVSAILAVAVSALTLGLTVTNWMAGLLLALVRRRWPAAIAITAGAFVTVLLLQGPARLMMPSTGFFLKSGGEGGHIFTPESLGVPGVARSMFAHTIVMPAIEVVDLPGAGNWPVLATQSSAIGSSGTVGLVATVLWFVLLGIGAVWLIWKPPFAELRTFVLLLLTGQFALHVAFGMETLLYAPNYLPVLLTIAVMAFLSPLRRVALTLAIALIVTAGINNIAQWRLANQALVQFGETEHNAVTEKTVRPDDFWPRPGSIRRISEPSWRSLEKAIHAPGGSFSPGTDQFNVAFWVVDGSGSIVTTSDMLDPSQVTSRAQESQGSVTSITTDTPYYTSTWAVRGRRHFELELVRRPGGAQVVMVIRSVGARPGPVRHLDWDGRRLLVNNRWAVTLTGAAVSVCAGLEGSAGWKTASCDQHSAVTPTGWGYARMELLNSGPVSVNLEDVTPTAPLGRPIAILGQVQSR